MKQWTGYIGSLLSISLALLTGVYAQQVGVGAANPLINAGPASADAPFVLSGNQAFIDWTRKHAIRLTTVEPGHGFRRHAAAQEDCW
jgi:hypothetical protein